MNILLCCDESYAQHACVCAYSLLANHPNQPFDLVFVIRDVEPETRRKIELSLSEFDHVAIRFETPITFPPDFAAAHREDLTIDCYQRFFVRTFFPDGERVLYLDCDMIVDGSLSHLFDVDLEGYALGAVPIPGSWPRRLGMPDTAPYFNSGVLLFNLPVWDEARCPEILLGCVHRHAKCLLEADQDALNACLSGRWLALDLIYNVTSPVFTRPDWLGLSGPELERVTGDARVVHFNGPDKPWSYRSEHSFKQKYWEYLAHTRYRDARPTGATVKNRVRRLASKILPAALETVLLNVWRTTRTAAPNKFVAACLEADEPVGPVELPDELRQAFRL